MTPVLLVDHYDQLGPVDDWIRLELLPSLSAEALVVLAGRTAPGASWAGDPGWRHLLTVDRLDPLDRVDSGMLLQQAGVDPDRCAALAELGRGHPLALALLGELAGTSGVVPDQLGDVPDLVTALLEVVISRAPTPAHAAGLATCSQAWYTTEDLLVRTVGGAATEVWDWLDGQPFVVRGPHGLTPHDLARDVLAVEFERRAPQRFRALARVVHDHVVAELRASSGAQRTRMAQELLFLHRRSPLTATFWSLRAQGSAAVLPARPEDQAQVVALLAANENAASAELATEWLDEIPDALHVVRDHGRVRGFAYCLLLPTGSALDQRDPVVRAVFDHAATAPPRPGELIHLARLVGGADGHQRDPYAALAISVRSVVDWVTLPLAWSYAAVLDTEWWAPYFDYLGFARIADVDVAGLPVAVFAMDWRRLPVDAWLAMMADRELSGTGGPPPSELLRPRPLSREQFGAAVQSGLRDLHDPNRLADNPLIGSRLVADGEGSAPERLRATLERGAERLADRPRSAELARVLEHTYLHTAATQERAAEALDLPFSTYRRHLAKAVVELTDQLWAIEIGRVTSAAELPAAPWTASEP